MAESKRMKSEKRKASAGKSAETTPSEEADYHFPCDGKCRICPFPGVNCRKAENKKLKENLYE